jgi:hypothetical protein
LVRLDGLILWPRDRDLHDTLGGPVHSPRNQRFQRLVGIAQRPPEHGHVDARDDAHPLAVGNAHRGVARRGAEDVREQQDVTAGRQRRAYALFDGFRRFVWRDVQGCHGSGRLCKSVLRHGTQCRSQRCMCND